jgi:hypothetical protein
MVADVPCTALVVTGKVTLVAPAGMMAVDGTLATDVLLLVKETIAPPVGAAPLSVNVPVDWVPPVTVLGLNVSDVRDAGVTVRVVVLVTPTVPEIVTEVEEATGLVGMVNVAVREPALTTTLPGTCATELLLLDSVTVVPPAGAAPLRVTVPVELLPPITELGLLVMDESVGALTVNVVVCVTPYVPEMVTEVFVETGLVVMVKVAFLEPAAIETLPGTWAAEVLLLLRITVAPAGGAAPLRVAVPVELLPPTTELGDLLNEDRVAAVTVRVALLLPPSEAVITEVVVEATPRDVTLKVADVDPAGTVTLAGTVATAVLLLVSTTEAPPVGAAPFKRTVPVELLPPTTLVGLRDTDETDAAGLTRSVAFAVPL